MSTCSRCQGLIAEPGKAYSYSGKFCHCGWVGESIPRMPLTPQADMGKIDPYKVPQEEIDKFMKRQAQSVQKPSMSHIINLIEQLTVEEAEALLKMIEVIKKGKQ